MKKCGICGCEFTPRTEEFVNCDKCSLERAKALMVTLSPRDRAVALVKMLRGDKDLVEWVEAR